MSNYFELYKHPNWQKRRLEILKKNNFRCQNCGEDESELHVHHKKYRSGAKPWEYTDEELMCLCDFCHKQAHEIKDDLNNILNSINNPYTKDCMVDMVKGFAFAEGAFTLPDGKSLLDMDNWFKIGFAVSHTMSRWNAIVLAKHDDFPYAVLQMAEFDRKSFQKAFDAIDSAYKELKNGQNQND